jgi:hypothetical protein
MTISENLRGSRTEESTIWSSRAARLSVLATVHGVSGNQQIKCSGSIHSTPRSPRMTFYYVPRNSYELRNSSVFTAGPNKALGRLRRVGEDARAHKAFVMPHHRPRQLKHLGILAEAQQRIAPSQLFQPPFAYLDTPLHFSKPIHTYPRSKWHVNSSSAATSRCTFAGNL